jgi:hypothetical protein
MKILRFNHKKCKIILRAINNKKNKDLYLKIINHLKRKAKNKLIYKMRIRN